MDKTLNTFLDNEKNIDFFVNESIQIDFLNFLLNFLIAAILSFCVQIIYLKCSSSLSNKKNFSNNFIVLALTTCLIIMVVKNSIALSLGLVGALSIVRFRAAIKEPEELIYLFLIISIGLGTGANQSFITIFGTLISLIVIFIYSLFKNKTNIENSEIVNLAIETDEKLNENTINDISNSISKYVSEIIFVSLSQNNEQTVINFDIRPNSFQDISNIRREINTKIKKSKIIFATNNNLAI